LYIYFPFIIYLQDSAKMNQWVSILSLGIFWLIFSVAAAITAGSTSFATPALASDLTIEDLMSRQDPLQDKVTICHIPEGDRTGANNITLGESVVPDHLAHGDRIGSCSPAKQPAITVEAPTSCISTENGPVAYARVILSGFPFGSVVMLSPESSGFPLQKEVQAETYSVPIGFSTGEKNVTVFADANRNAKQDSGEVSATKTFTVTCYRNS
jgi:hypothetical protein